MSELSGPWVCSVCGSGRIQESSIQSSLGDPRHPLGLCWECRGDKPLPNTKKTGPIDTRPVKHLLSALCRPDEFAGRPRKSKPADPEDLFGALPDDERKALERPLRW